MENSTSNSPEMGTYDLQQLRPVWKPYNEAGRCLVSHVCKQYDIPTEGRYADRYQVVVASFLVAARQILRSNKDLPQHFGCSKNNNAFTNYPLVGRTIILETIDKLVEGSLIRKNENSGVRFFYKNENGNTEYKDIVTMYIVDPGLLNYPNFKEAEFIEVGRQFIKIQKPEIISKKKQREKYNDNKPSYSDSKARRDFRKSYSLLVKQMKELNSFWQKHPLQVPGGNLAASATRIFHNGRLDAGGRFYGLWTTKKNNQRLKSTIDGEAIVSIDINASQPVLFSALKGRKFGNSDTWEDLYGEIAEQLVDQDMDKLSDARELLKSVGLELLGTGNHQKARSSRELEEETGITQKQWEKYRDALVAWVPALEHLDTNYNNGANFISYHESEMVYLTMQKLMLQKIPSYPVHDCLLVKISDQEKALEVFRQTIGEYISKFNNYTLRVIVAVSLESTDNKVRVSGEFIN